MSKIQISFSDCTFLLYRNIISFSLLTLLVSLSTSRNLFFVCVCAFFGIVYVSDHMKADKSSFIFSSLYASYSCLRMLLFKVVFLPI